MLYDDIVAAVDPAARLVKAQPLDGATSASVVALDIARPGAPPRRLVLRRYDDGRHHVGTQFRLLEVLSATGLNVAKPWYVDESAHTLVTDFIDGQPGHRRTDGENVGRQMAQTLVAIHQRPAPDFLPAAREPGRTLLHGDFWPGNTVWRDDQMVAVIDWEDAAIGDPLADLANARCELTMFFGAAARETFTGHYRAATGIDTGALPAWDLLAAQRPAELMTTWGLDEATVGRLRAGLREFVDQALRGR